MTDLLDRQKTMEDAARGEKETPPDDGPDEFDMAAAQLRPLSRRLGQSVRNTRVTRRLKLV